MIRSGLISGRLHFGYTLIELLLVIAILSIVVSLAVPKVQVGIDNREAHEVLQTLRSIQHAMKMFETDYERVPLDIDELKDAGYFNTKEASATTDVLPEFQGYSYEVDYEGAAATNPIAQAARKWKSGCGPRSDVTARTITLSRDGRVDDSEDVLDDAP